MKTVFLFAITLIAFLSASSPAGSTGTSDKKVVISGYIRDAVTGDPLPWANFFIEELRSGTTANAEGYYALTVKEGQYNIRISFLGYEELMESLNLRSNTVLNFELRQSVTRLSEFTISDKRGNENITETQMGVVRMNTETIKKIPALMGETDLLKTIQLLPGVQNTAEGFSGFSVRGGSADQNLMLIDDATVYNAAHLMGFFSVFNSDAIQEMTLYKGDIPAQYGGRLASLVDVEMKEGNMKELAGNGGIGTISSRLTLETPIITDRSSLLISGRRTYADLFLKLSNDSLLNNNQLYFYDLNAKATFVLNKHNRLYLSGYSGKDVFAFRELVDMRWANMTNTVRWNSLISEKLTANFLYTYTNYDYELKTTMGLSNYIWSSGINDHSIKADFSYYHNNNSTLRFGGQATHHNYKPGTISSLDNELIIEMADKNSLEYALFGSTEIKISEKFHLQAGLRFSAIQNIGEAKVFLFDNSYEVTDTLQYGKGDIYNTYAGLEPRLSAAWIISERLSVKSSISRTRQYVQPASNSSSGMPHDVWFPVSPNLKPQVSDQISTGVFRNMFNNTIEISAEIYYKEMDNQIDFRDNANMFFNDLLEGEIRTGIAKAYGVEFLARKNNGSLTGWIGYTYSKARRKIENINNDNWYDANYDKPHNLTIVLNYELNSRLNLGATWVYTTGGPVTLPTSRWEYAGMIMPGYSERNGYRLPDYHRLDISATIKLNRTEKISGFSNELNISAYNAYNRKNPFTIFFTPEEKGSNNMKAYALSMFGIVPSITWNFRF